MKVLTVYAHPNPASFCHDVLESMNLKQRILDAAGGPVRRWIAGRWLQGKDAVAQWEKVKGIKKVEHEYFYGAAVADDDTRRGYLNRAYELGRGFAQG